MQVTSKLRYARISPQKCRLVADLVRGKPVGNAIASLTGVRLRELPFAPDRVRGALGA